MPVIENLMKSVIRILYKPSGQRNLRIMNDFANLTGILQL